MKKLKSLFRKFLIIFAVLLVASLGIYAYIKFSVTYYSPMERVPGDGIFIIQTDNGAKAWRKISESAFWKHLQKQADFRELTQGTDAVNALFSKYPQFTDWVFSGKDITVSAHPHPSKKSTYEFLLLADMGGRFSIPGTETLNTYLEGYEIVPSDSFNTIPIHKVYDLSEPESAPLVSFAFLNNLFIASPSDSLVRLTILGKNTDYYAEDEYFQIAQREAARGIGDLYVQYDYLDEFAGYFLEEQNPYVKDLSRSLRFSALGLEIDKEGEELEVLSLQGATTIRDTLGSYVRAAMASGRGDVRAPRILPQNTSFYFSLTFEDFLTFYDNVDAFLQEDERSYAEYEKSVRKLEKFLKINLREDVMSWMADEMAVVHINRSDLAAEDRFALAIRSSDINFARERLSFITDQVRRKTPVKFKTFEYNRHQISFLSIKGFFKIFLGRYFDKIEKPYFTIVEDYVVFSNSPQTLKSIIDDYQADLTLAADENFRDFFYRFNDNSTFFAYLNTGTLPNTMRGFLDTESYTDLRLNRNFIVCFSQIGMQLREDDGMFETKLYAHFEEPSKVRNRMNDLIAAQRKYQREGNKQRGLNRITSMFSEENMGPQELPASINVLSRDLLSEDDVRQLNLSGRTETGYYESGALKYKVRTRDYEGENGEVEKVRDGLYKEYYEDGKTLKIRGRYRQGIKEGIWKTYNKRGLVIDKEQYLQGEKELF